MKTARPSVQTDGPASKKRKIHHKTHTELNLCDSCQSLACRNTRIGPFSGVCSLCINMMPQAQSIAKSVLEKMKDFEFQSYDIALGDIPILTESHRMWCSKVHGVVIHQPVKNVLRERIRTIVESSLPAKTRQNNVDADLSVTVNFANKRMVSVGKRFKLNLAKRRRNKHPRSQIEDLVGTKDDAFWRDFLPVDKPMTFSLHCFTKHLLVGCKYNKYSREISHSDSFGKLKEKDSMEQIIHRILKKTIPHESHVMVSCGREDMNVLMLGGGRPIVFELKVPQIRTVTQAMLNSVLQEVNNSTKDVQITDLKVVDEDYFSRIKREVEFKDKSYRCVVWTENVVTQEELDKLNHDKFYLKQWTPVRVLHRRPNLERTRYVEGLRAEVVKPNWVVVYLRTQAGTYIKEFIHGDRGRTVPSLGTLLECRTLITQLDVTEVHHDLDSPPPLGHTSLPPKKAPT